MLNQPLVSLLTIWQLMPDRNELNNFFSSSNNSRALFPLIAIYFKSSAYGGNMNASSLFSMARSSAESVSSSVKILEHLALPIYA
jgi:hypothetical protein